ncbi:MAG: SpoIIE family protein phosphatase [Verrucomicrobiae bacterium]|nr:SpoIIE family protein phosphatase [Verrucomicrobiae bacterium]NNJ44361.1 SpoIIE family protein phosphatase [Akkermansiaceae bacterium]
MATHSQDRLELALKASNEGVWDWYVGEDDIDYSEHALKILGHEAARAPNIITHAQDLLHEDDLPHFHQTLNNALADNGQDILACECRYRHPDGSWHWLRIRGIATRDPQGKAVRMVGTIIDISQRKAAEVALDEERYRLRELIENIPVNVYYKDKESRFVIANASIAKRLGAETEQDLLGKTDHHFFGQAHADMARSDEIRIMQSREPQINTIQRENWEGKDDTWVEITKLPWLDRKGKLLGTFGITSDITNLVKTQRKLSTVAEELHTRNVAFEEELHLAREIQHALLPRAVAGIALQNHEREITFSSRYSPASEMAGDFFEIMPLSEDSIGIFLCDVMGHGVRASLIVSMLRGLMEKERDSATNPDWFLHGINEGLVSILERASVTLFATAIYCVINNKEGTLSYSCAGHPAPIVVHTKKSAQLTPNNGKPSPALGLIPHATYSVESVSLNEIDRMLLFTDGLHEVENTSAEQMGIEHITSTMQNSINDDLEISLDTLIDQARRHAADGKFEDDVCLFAMDVNARA